MTRAWWEPKEEVARPWWMPKEAAVESQGVTQKSWDDGDPDWITTEVGRHFILVVCKRCYSMVPYPFKQEHLDYHNEMGEILHQIAENYQPIGIMQREAIRRLVDQFNRKT